MPKRTIVVTAALVALTAVHGPAANARPEVRPERRRPPGLDENLANLVLSSRPPVPSAPAAAAASQAAVDPGRGGKGVRRGDVLARIRACESKSDYRARSSSGRYRGAYQMDRATFASVGGTGDPASASRAEQDHRAQLLYEQRGSQPWPNCATRA